MRRRDLITLLGGAAIAWPLRARAQRQALPIVGYLSSGSPDLRLQSVLGKGLSETGYDLGRNVAIEYRYAESRLDRLPALAADLVQRRVAVIVTSGSATAALAAKAVTATTPIVFSMASDPIETGLVTSLNRPGGNVTGFTELNTEVTAKRLGLLHELITDASHFALLIEPNTPGAAATVITNLQVAASAIGLKIDPLPASGTIDDIDSAIGSLSQSPVGAILVNPSLLFYGLRAQLAARMARHALPAIYWDRAFPDAGGLMSYRSSAEDLHYQVGIYAGRILKGEKPADLPVQQAAKFDLVVNLKAAKAIGLAIPPSLLLRADEVIE